jgi:cellulose synthase/poly-beta-1,6-N-acetylglucosamine synthase-like glycosyltransferase/peptidoglycan/xylan/chitin deacetylase (PgdA/CDA1 family)/spore germination protein YaaH
MSAGNEQSIFADPRGIRRRLLQVAAVVGMLLIVTASAYFIWGLLVSPGLKIPAAVREYQARMKALPPSKTPSRDAKDDWRRIYAAARDLQAKKGSVKAIHPRQGGIVLGHVSPWDPASILSLERHAEDLTHVASDWFAVTGVEATLNEEAADKVRLLCVRNGIAFLPILRNLEGEEWQPEAIETLANASDLERNAFLNQLISRLPPGSKGLLVEWAQLDPAQKEPTSRLIQKMAEQLHAAGKELWFSVPTGNDFDAFDMELIADCADRLVAGLYDENSEAGDPGPLASSDWFQGWLKTMMIYGDPDQWVIGLGAYGYDWRKQEGVAPQQIGFADVMARAADAGVDPASVDTAGDSPHFNYLGGESENQEHEVWFLDAVTFANERRLIAPYHPAGIALYKLGSEDPDIWNLLRNEQGVTTGAKALTDLSTISLEKQIASTGSGDFLTVGPESRPGARSVRLLPDGEIAAKYLKFPIPESIMREGDPGVHKVALTFDDGPDPKWTPKILQILKEKKAPAAFFVLGIQAQHFPDLLERIAKEGHEIGNHSYSHQNLAETGDPEIELELNATTRLIEAITDRSTAYFRPPYNSDGTPAQPDELRALRVARDLGYLTVTQSIDPDDWERPGAEALLRRVKSQRAAGGSVILLHDAGGDRSQTVAALPAIIDYLRERGDIIVPLSEIIDLPRDTVMPPLREEDQPLSTRYVYGGFTFLRILETTVWTLLVVVTLLALLRVLFNLCCALLEKKRTRLQASVPVTPFYPPLSVLLAAYNEERVIASTIGHLLDAEYPYALEIVVVDDGSTDGTAAVVEGIALKEPRVRFFRQPNGGKPSALRKALAEATHDTIVMIDADTMVSHDGLRELVAPLADPAVGAVSGYIRVGNTKGWLGKFQDLEYAIAFEIDRRAQDYLGCIVVAPGALSAFRGEALKEAGPITNDTLAEDTDLTLQLHRLGWKVVFAPAATADTEAPESVKALLSQRFRWAFGTLQCLWKHGDRTFAPGSGWVGWFALPSIWVFQMGVVAITPVLDLVVLWSLWLGRGIAIWPYFLASLLLDAALAVAALALARRKLRDAWLSVPMRLLYRPLLGYVVWKCILKALGGSWVRWSKLERTAAAIRQREYKKILAREKAQKERSESTTP